MKVYVFGNEDVFFDNLAFEAAEKLKEKIKNIQFIKVLPNQDLPFVDEKLVIILDTVYGISEVTEITDVSKFGLSKSSSVHDFDLSFQLKYLKKIGKLGRVIIIGIPMSRKIDYLRIQSILRKLVAQDMQGS